MCSPVACFIRSYLQLCFEEILSPSLDVCLRAEILRNRCEHVRERARQWHTRQEHGGPELDDTRRYFDLIRFDSVLDRNRCRARMAHSDLLPLIATQRVAARAADLPCWRRAMQTCRIPQPHELEMYQCFLQPSPCRP